MIKRPITAFLLLLLCHAALAEPALIPDLILTDLQRTSHNLRAQEHQIILVAKPGQKYRQQNKDWMKALVEEFEQTDTRIWLVADLSSRPPFASQDRVIKKLKSEAEPASKKYLLLDWDGKLRQQLDLDSQHHVYLLGPGGEILAQAIGLYRKEKLDSLAQAR